MINLGADTVGRRFGAAAAALVVAAMVALVAAAGIPVAGATTRSFQDANDVKGPLDIARASHGHRSNGKLTHAIRTFGRWSNRQLRGEARYFALWLDVRGSSAPERLIWIRHDRGGGLRARIYRASGGDSPWEAMTQVPVWRVTPKALRVAFKRKWLGKDTDEYRWRASSSFEREAKRPCRAPRYVIYDDMPPEGRCLDFAPNNQRYRTHQLKG